MTPEQVVQKQLDFYNNHDIEGFISTYSSNIEIYNIGDTTPYLKGLEDLRERYTKRFETPGLHAEIEKRITQGNFVVDHEKVTVISEGREVKSSVIATYEVKDGLIVRVWFAR